MFNNVMDIFIFVLGMASTVFTCAMNVPLTWKVFKTKHTASLSVVTLVLTLSTCFVWLTYAILIVVNGYMITFVNPLLASLPLLISNVLLTFLISYTLTIKLRNDHKVRAELKKNKIENATETITKK